MADVFGEDLVVEVETAVPGTFIPVANMNRYSDSATAGSRTYHTFGASKKVVPGATEDSFTISGYLDDADPGQKRLVAMKEAKTPANIRVKVNGTDGFSQNCLVTEASHDADADPEALQERSFRLVGQGVRTKVGTGGGIMS